MWVSVCNECICLDKNSLNACISFLSNLNTFSFSFLFHNVKYFEFIAKKIYVWEISLHYFIAHKKCVAESWRILFETYGDPAESETAWLKNNDYNIEYQDCSYVSKESKHGVFEKYYYMKTHISWNDSSLAMIKKRGHLVCIG